MAVFFGLGEMILITPDLSSISIGLDTSDEPATQTITVAENKLTSTGYNFGNVEENIYVNSSEDGKELLVKNGYKIKYVEYPKTVGNGGTLYKPGTTFNSVRDSTKTTYISIEAASSKISIDLTTLTGWDNVTDGEHQISVIAKASGYLDSEKSTAVSFTKASNKVLLEKGTYIIKPEPYFNLATDETISGKMYTLTANDTYGEQTSFDSISLIKKEPGGLGSILILNSTDSTYVSCAGSEWKYLNTDGEEFTLSENTQTTLKIRTIVFETDQYVSQEFYNWVTTQGNFTKEGEQEKYRLTLAVPTIEASINSTKITEYPYILKDNDIILLENKDDASSTTRGIQVFYIENNVQTSIRTHNGVSSGTISNSDVSVSNDNQESTTIYDFTLTFKQSASTGETWVLNDNISSAKTLEKTEINFTSNNTQYTALQYKRSTLGYYTADGSLIDIADADIMDETTSWTNVAYKTITFNTVPTGALLTWLQANGTKQGGGTTTAHKLTWSDSTMVVTVNGNAATSPYTLANGDEIVLKRTSGYQSYNIITDTGSFDTDTTQSPLAVNNSDIKLQNGEIDMSPSVHMGFTINYTE